MNNLSSCGLSAGLADSSLAQGVPENLHYPLVLGRADPREKRQARPNRWRAQAPYSGCRRPSDSEKPHR